MASTTGEGMAPEATPYLPAPVGDDEEAEMDLDDAGLGGGSVTESLLDSNEEDESDPTPALQPSPAPRPGSSLVVGAAGPPASSNKEGSVVPNPNKRGRDDRLPSISSQKRKTRLSSIDIVFRVDLMPPPPPSQTKRRCPWVWIQASWSSGSGGRWLSSCLQHH